MRPDPSGLAHSLSPVDLPEPVGAAAPSAAMDEHW